MSRSVQRHSSLILLSTLWLVACPVDGPELEPPISAEQEAILSLDPCFLCPSGARCVDGECLLDLLEVCDGVDNDNDGLVDEGLLRPCENRCGIGYEDCVDGEWVNCDAPEPEPEVCNGLDDDCDWVVDEALLFRSCANGCGPGLEFCVEGGWNYCTAPEPSPETCNNQDDDCDWQTDEGLTRLCQTICGSGNETCTAGQWGNCNAPQPEPEVCNGLDDDCNGKVDDNIPPRNCRSGGTASCYYGSWQGCAGSR